jgi:hypothetical protein
MNNIPYKAACTGCVSELRDFAKLFFSWFDNIGTDAAIAILLPSLKRFSCNGAVEWKKKRAFAV